MDDNSLMPWGQYVGKKMANVPAYYLIWLLDNNKCSGEVKTYIKDNEDTLREEAKNRD